MDKKKIIYADLKVFLLFMLFLSVTLGTAMRGLYFDPDLLPFHTVSAALFGIMIFDNLLKKEGDFMPTAMDYSIFVLMLGYIISSWNAVYIRGAIRDALIYINFFILYIVTWQTIQKEKDISCIINMMYFSTLVIAGIGIADTTGIIDFPGAFENKRMLSTFQYANAFGIFMVVGLFLALGMWHSSEKLMPKSIHAAMIYILTLGLLASQSRASWATYLLLIAIVFFLLREEFADLLYAHIFYIGTALVISRWFIPCIIAKEHSKSLIVLAIGVALVIGFELLRKPLAQLIEKIPEGRRKIITISGFSYLVIVVVIYASYLSSAVPSVTEKFVSSEVATRASTIGSYNASFEFRKVYIVDGLKMGLDYLPFGAGGEGWNALYHKYQSFMYWSTEPHSHPIKIWVEAGIFGIIGYLCLWFFGGFKALASLSNIKDPATQKKFFFLSISLIALFIHSAMDFELSLPGMLFFAGVGLGTIRGTYSVVNDRRKLISYKKLIPIAIVLVIIIVPFYQTSRNLTSAGEHGALGARALKEKNIPQALSYYKKAHDLDPNNHAYVTDLAQILTVVGLEDQNSKAFEAGKKYTKLAITLNPYDIRIQGRLINLFIMQRDYPFAVGTSENFVSMSPLNMDAYEILAQAYFASLENALRNSDNTIQEKLLSKLDGINNTLSKMGERPRRSGEFWQGEKVRPTPLTEVIFAKAQIVKGNYQWADEILQKYIKDKEVGREARIWRAVITLKLAKTLDTKLTNEERQLVAAIASYLN